MDKKIVFFDIDGTIYKYDMGIPKDTFESIQQLKENGHIPVICTGRTRCMIYREHLLPGFQHIVAGAGTYVEIDGKEIFHAKLDEKEARRVINSFIKNGFVPVAEGRDHIYIGTDKKGLTEKNQYVLKVYESNIGDAILSTVEKKIDVSKVSAMFTYHSNMENMIKEYRDTYNIIKHNDNLLELIPNNYNKAKGIEKMINYLGISWENTYAFGDSFNDIDMLKYVKYGCAMGNSDMKIKSQVKYITSDFDKGGIRDGLEMFGLI